MLWPLCSDLFVLWFCCHSMKDYLQLFINYFNYASKARWVCPVSAVVKSQKHFCMNYQLLLSFLLLCLVSSFMKTLMSHHTLYAQWPNSHTLALPLRKRPTLKHKWLVSFVHRSFVIMSMSNVRSKTSIIQWLTVFSIEYQLPGISNNCYLLKHTT